MLIAVPFENEEVYPLLGKAEKLKLYNFENALLKETMLIECTEEDREDLPDFLYSLGIDMVICNIVSKITKDELEEFGIKVNSGADGDADMAVMTYLMRHGTSLENGCESCGGDCSGCSGCH